jgi:hypothetical protein
MHLRFARRVDLLVAALLTRARVAQIGLREKSNFASAFKAIRAVQSCREKYFASVFRKLMLRCRHPASMKEGRIAIVTTREAGMRWTRA